jgi:hypothetical protein
MSGLALLAAASIEFLGPCSVQPLLRARILGEPANLGVATIETLERFGVDYEGTEQGLNSAFGTPTGMAAMEVVSDREMRSYGWCYEVDGKVPEVYANEVPMRGVREVRWYFAYAHYFDGQWVAQCVPAHRLRPRFLNCPQGASGRGRR